MICSAVTTDLASRTVRQQHKHPNIALKQAIRGAVIELLGELGDKRTVDLENFEIWLTSEDRCWHDRLSDRNGTDPDSTAKFLANGNLAEEISIVHRPAANILGIVPKAA